jgi:hypothetical protein
LSNELSCHNESKYGVRYTKNMGGVNHSGYYMTSCQFEESTETQGVFIWLVAVSVVKSYLLHVLMLVGYTDCDSEEGRRSVVH